MGHVSAEIFAERETATCVGSFSAEIFAERDRSIARQ